MTAGLYLDANATEPMRPEALAAAMAAMAQPGNASAVHASGRQARAVLELARQRLAESFGAPLGGVIFTSGATEANLLALHGLGLGRRLLLGATEHASLLGAPGAAALPVGPDGRLVLDALRDALAGGPPALVCLMAANNETGVLHPLAEAAALCYEHGALVHVDAVQSAGRLPLSLAATGADSMAISGHKLGGAPGAGALLLRAGLEVKPLLPGGGQERGRRGGTEALPAIAALGAAVAASRGGAAHLAPLRDAIEAGVRALTPDVTVAGAEAPRLPNTTCLVVPAMRAESLVIALDLAGVRASSGAACSSGKVSESHVLRAMGFGPLAAHGLRLSLPWNAAPDTAERFLGTWSAMQSRLSRRASALT